MRRIEPTRHGRAADALIASYVRELLAEEPTTPTNTATGDPEQPLETPLAALARPSGEPTTDATA
jgi:hypothetical protein